MDYPCGNARQPPQALEVIKVARKRGQAFGPQFLQTPRTGCQRQHPNLAWHPDRHAQPDIATSDDKNAFAPKAGRQGSERVLV
jgi:hypothetical protein